VPEQLPIDLLRLSDARPPGFIPRPSAELVERIRRYGPIDAVVVRPTGSGRYEILSRPEVWVATGRAGRHEVPVLIRYDLTAEQAEAIVREQYVDGSTSPLDEARRLKADLDAQPHPEARGAITEVAARAGRSRAYVAHALRLLELPTDVQQLVESGRLTPGHVRPLVALRDPDRQRALAREFVELGFTVRAAEQRVRALRAETPPPDASPASAPSTADADLQRLESVMTDLLGCQFRLDTRRGVAEIAYYGNLEILQGVLERLGYRS
jgi:ParB family chromosome partitioning protein